MFCLFVSLTLGRQMMGDESLGAENRSENDPGWQDLGRGWGKVI